MLKLTPHHHVAIDHIADIQYKPSSEIAMDLGKGPTVMPVPSSLTFELKNGEDFHFGGEEADRIWADYESQCDKTEEPE